VTWDLEQDTLSSAIRVKVLLGIGLELPLITEIDEELLAMKGITDEAFPTVFGDEPINDTKTQGRISLKIGENPGNVRMSTIESLETRDDKFGLTFNASLTCLRFNWVGIHY
jgi:hypothetical protein